MDLGKILFGVAAIIAAWKFGSAAERWAHGQNERLEAEATAIIAESGVDQGPDEPTVH